MRRWNCFHIATEDEPEPDFYPVRGDRGGLLPVGLERADGTDLIRIPATEVRISEKADHGWEVVAEPPAHCKWELVITDARLVLYCQNLHKGGGYRGFDPAGLLIAGAANAVSNGLAARRNKDELLVAHVRYPWLGNVCGRTKVNRRTNDSIQIYVDAEPEAGDQLIVVLSMTLGKGADGLTVAQQIARRVARYRLRHHADTMDDTVRRRFEELADTPRIAGDPLTGWSTYSMPMLYKVNELSAFPPGHDRSPLLA